MATYYLQLDVLQVRVVAGRLPRTWKGSGPGKNWARQRYRGRLRGMLTCWGVLLARRRPRSTCCVLFNDLTLNYTITSDLTRCASWCLLCHDAMRADGDSSHNERIGLQRSLSALRGVCRLTSRALFSFSGNCDGAAASGSRAHQGLWDVMSLYPGCFYG